MWPDLILWPHEASNNWVVFTTQFCSLHEAARFNKRPGKCDRTINYLVVVRMVSFSEKTKRIPQTCALENHIKMRQLWMFWCILLELFFGFVEKKVIHYYRDLARSFLSHFFWAMNGQDAIRWNTHKASNSTYMSKFCDLLSTRATWDKKRA